MRLHLVPVVIACLLPHASLPYELSGYKWPDATTSFSVDIADSPPWNSAFQKALDQWSEDAFQYNAIMGSYESPCTPPNGRNGVDFSLTNCGTEFGEYTLAVSLIYYQGDEILKSSIIFNANKDWDIYSGPLNLSAGIYDFQRVALHELGHALGLGHENQAASIMNPYISDFDSLQVDDRLGIAAVYGPTECAPLRSFYATALWPQALPLSISGELATSDCLLQKTGLLSRDNTESINDVGDRYVLHSDRIYRITLTSSSVWPMAHFIRASDNREYRGSSHENTFWIGPGPFNLLVGESAGYIPASYTIKINLSPEPHAIEHDINTNHEADTPVLGITSDGKSAVLFLDSSTGKLAGSFAFPGWFAPTESFSVNDVNGDSNNDILSWGQTSDGYQAWLLHDPYSRSILLSRKYPRWMHVNKIIPVRLPGESLISPALSLSLTTSDGKSVHILENFQGQRLRTRISSPWLKLLDQLIFSDAGTTFSKETMTTVLLERSKDQSSTYATAENMLSGTQISSWQYPYGFRPIQFVPQPHFGHDTHTVLTLGIQEPGMLAVTWHDYKSGELLSSIVLQNIEDSIPHSLFEPTHLFQLQPDKLVLIGYDPTDGSWKINKVDSSGNLEASWHTNGPAYSVALHLEAMLANDGYRGGRLIPWLAVSGKDTRGYSHMYQQTLEPGFPAKKTMLHLPKWFSVKPVASGKIVSYK